MSGREVREYTNLVDPKDRRYGKGKEKIDEEGITFQRMVSKMQDVAGERGGYLHGRGAMDSDDLLYLKEQMDAEQDAERLLRRTEKRAFLAFKAVADTSPAAIPLSSRVEPKAKSGIRQQDILKRVVKVKPKRQKVCDAYETSSLPAISVRLASTGYLPEGKHDARESSPASASEGAQEKAQNPEAKRDNLSSPNQPSGLRKEDHVENPIKSLISAYASSDDED